MKKLLCLILTLIMVLSISGTCFATADGLTIDDNETPGTVRNVDTATYKEEETTKIIESEEIPQGVPGTSSETIEIEEQSVPAGSVLPNTGGIPAEAFYVAGALLIVVALMLSMKKTKAGQNN